MPTSRDRRTGHLSGLKGNVIVLGATASLTYFAESMAYPYELLYLQALGAPALAIGLLGSLASLLVLVSRLLGAYAADSRGRKGVAVLATFGVALSYSVIAAAPFWWIAAVGVALVGAFSSLSLPAIQALIADSAASGRRGLAYALVDTLPSALSVFAPISAALLVERSGLVQGVRLVYALGALLALSAGLVRALWLEETLVRAPEPPSLSARLVSSVKGAIAMLKGVQAPLLPLAVALVVNSFEESMFRFMPLYVVGVAGIGETEWALLSSIFFAVPLVAGIPLGLLVDSIGRRRSMLLAYALWVPATIYFVQCRSTLEMALVFTAFSLGASLFNPAYQAMLADLAPREARGRVMGAVGALRLLASIPASALAGLLYSEGPAYPFLLAAILGATNTAVVALLVEEPSTHRE